MSQSLTYIELDIPFCALTYGVAPCTAAIPTTGDIKCFNSIATCQDRDNFDERTVTLRFAKNTEYLPREIDCIPNILSVDFSPAIVSLGAGLGQRASLTVTFRDLKHADTGDGYDNYLADRNYDPFEQGTYWGKFRARQPFLRGRALRWITGRVGDAISDMETRTFYIESFSGPGLDGKFTITAKDIFKLADGDRAQAPLLSNGFLSADITAVAGSCTLLPSGIGNEEYPAAGLVSIGGNECAQFTRSGDVLTLTVRGDENTTAKTHKAGDRVQLCLQFDANDVADILYVLLGTYAGVPTAYMPLTDWEAETAAFLGTLYSAVICEPTSVKTLVTELCEQAGLVLWDDQIAEQIRLQVLRAVVTSTATFTPENTIKGSLQVKEQPDKRLSRVQVYFGQIDPTKPLSNLDNYRSTTVAIDEDAETDYGSQAIKVILARWIPQGGRSIADRLAAIQIGRYRDPPRQVQFRLQRYAETDVVLGVGYRVEATCIQDATGAAAYIPFQATRLNPGPAELSVEGEEMLWTAPETDTGTRALIFDANRNNINLRTEHDSIYPAPQSGDVVNAIINAGVIIGSTGTTPLRGFDVGSWPSGVTINLTVNGLIEGKGGNGGTGAQADAPNNGSAAGNGGTALYTRYPINLSVSTGFIWGGGGGGGGGGGRAGGAGGGGGGGGGTIGGFGGQGGNGAGLFADGQAGQVGTADNGGNGGTGSGNGQGPGGGKGGDGGSGGNPGFAGTAGASPPFGGSGGAAGAAGAAIDGVSFVTVLAGPGDIRGSQIN